ncbi:MAG: ABC transporter ATP-binding protein [Armatimonadetes bacterium]|nr:ABC transporter ATP-binding protein [Armatimonadota bacterium]
MPLLEVDNLSVRFDTPEGPVQAVNEVSFHLAKGETLGIVGESGCGKSATVLALMRLLPPPGRIAGGSVRFEGSGLLTLPEETMRRLRGDRIGMVFQDPFSALNPVLTIGEQIGETIRAHRRAGRREVRERSVGLLQSVGIAGAERRLRQFPHEFSGGMRQRALIAMATACRPDLLIADEPTTALDVTIQAQILNLLRDLTRQSHTAVILITHDLGIVADFCERVLVMYAGRIVESAPARVLFSRPRHPYTAALLRSLPYYHADRSEALASIEGAPPSMLAPPAGCPFAPRCPSAFSRCLAERPPLLSAGEAHGAACWLAEETDQGTSPESTDHV